MKKIVNDTGGISMSFMKKNLLKMKLTFLCLFLSFVQLLANDGFSQSTRVTLNLKDAKVEDVLMKIEEQSQLYFIYNRNVVDVTRTINVSCTNQKVTEVLNGIFTGTDVDYEIQDRHIILKSSSEPISQTKSISGKVTDSSGSPLPGASVIIKGTTTGSITDTSGNYSLANIPETATLQFSFIGMKSQEISVTGKTSLSVSLIEITIGIDEVVSIGYGTQHKSALTSSIASVKKASFTQGNMKDAAQLIQGKVAGVGVILPDGDPTSTSQIILRGSGTLLSGNSPLVIIDGVPGNLSTVAPEDIESIDVLKDGSAAAIYGTRGNNGVIVITTKKIHGDAEARVEVQSYITVQSINKKLDMMNATQYRELVKQNIPGAIDYGSKVDWLDEILRTPVSSVTNASFQGGSSATNYVANINYKSAEGIVKRSDNEVLTTRLAANHSMWDNLLKLNFNIMGRQQTYQSLGDGNSFNGSIYRTALIGNPTDRVKDDNETWVEHTTMNGYMNPVAAIYETDGQNKNTQIKTFGSITLTPVDQFFVKALVSNTTFNETRGYSETMEHISTIKDKRNGFASRGATRSTERLMELTTQYREVIDQHDLTVLAGYSYQQNQYENYWMQNWDFPSDQYSYNNMGAGAAVKRGEAPMSSSKDEHKLIGFFGRINYSFDNRFLLSASVRHEGSSKFGKNHKWGNFPAISAGWNLSNEEFVKDIDVISNLKLRVGFGVTGTVPTSPYMSLSKLNTGDNFYTKDGWIPTLKPASNANPNLKWEKKEEWNFGLDFGLYKQLIQGSFDFYKRTTKDMLWSYTVPMPPFLYNSMIANAGTMENKGFEAQIIITPIKNSAVTWNSTINYSTNKNELLSLSNDQFQVHTGYIETGWTGEPIQRNTHRIFEGGEMGSFWGFKTVGVNEDGRWLIEGENGEEKSILDQTDADRKKIGNGIPKHLLSWNNYVSFKNFDMSITMRGAFGYDILNMPRMFYEVPVSLTRGNLLENAFEPKFGHVLNNQQELQYVSYFIEKGDFWKIDNITFGYNLQFNNKYFKKLRIYGSASNLFTFTSYSGIDPEVNVNGLDPGVDELGRYPSTRSFTLGAIINF